MIQQRIFCRANLHVHQSDLYSHQIRRKNQISIQKFKARKSKCIPSYDLDQVMRNVQIIHPNTQQKWRYPKSVHTTNYKLCITQPFEQILLPIESSISMESQKVPCQEMIITQRTQPSKNNTTQLKMLLQTLRNKKNLNDKVKQIEKIITVICDILTQNQQQSHQDDLIINKNKINDFKNIIQNNYLQQISIPAILKQMDNLQITNSKTKKKMRKSKVWR